MPYFLSKPSTDAMTTEAQSVSGIKPILTSDFSGASEPAAHARLRRPAGINPHRPAAPAATKPAFRKWRRALLTRRDGLFLSLISINPLLANNKKAPTPAKT